MSIRESLLYVALVFMWLYAMRDWLVSLCGLIVMTVLMQNELPTNIGGIQGLNPWNVTICIITVVWFARRRLEHRAWNVPAIVPIIILGYVGVLFVAYLRAALDLQSFPPEFHYSFMSLTSDELINPLKFCWAAFLLADGCWNNKRTRIAIAAVVAVGVFYGALMVKIMPPSALIDSSMIHGVRRRIDRELGLHANDMARLLVLAFWGIVVSHQLWPKRWHKAMAVVGGVLCLLGIAYCFSRAGFLTFLAVGLILGLVRWRKLLAIGPLMLIVVPFAMPSVLDRLGMGFQEAAPGSEQVDWNQVTAGRTGNLWPPVIDAIQQAPILGHGRRAILRTSAYEEIVAREFSCPTTPHNGYLEVMIDSGVVGMTVVGTLFLGSGLVSFYLLRRFRHDPVAIAAGGLGLVHSFGCLINAMSGGILFPTQGLLPTLAAMGIAVRVWGARRGREVPVRRRARVARPAARRVNPRVIAGHT